MSLPAPQGVAGPERTKTLSSWGSVKALLLVEKLTCSLYGQKIKNKSDNGEINELNNMSISNADKKNNIWCIELKISGDKYAILEEIKKLDFIMS